MQVRDATPADRPWIEAFLDLANARRVARRGQVVDPLDHPMLISESDGARSGLLTFVVTGEDCEILTLHVVRRGAGAGSALVTAVRSIAAERGCRRLWVLTTNDNVDALRFYQRRGFRLTALRPGAVDEARLRLKPEIPEIGDHGIPLRDEIELALELPPGAPGLPDGQ